MIERRQRSSFVLGLATIVFFAVYAALGAARFGGYNAGMLDLGNMAQAIWSVTEGHPLVHTNPAGNVSRLSGHVELLYLALTPLLWIARDPRVLLIAQAALFASGAFAAYRIAHRRLSPGTSLLFALGYLVFPTAVAAVLFDLHGDTLALPLLLWMLDALDARAWRRFWLFLALGLMSKFYIAAPVFVLGATLLSSRTAPLDLAALPRRRTLGIAICAVAALYAVVLMLAVRPLFDTPEMGASGGYLRYYFGSIATLGWFDVVDRVLNLTVVLLPTAFFWWWARWTALPAFAIIVPAVVSTGPGAAYAWSYHHYAAAVPFLIVATIVGVAHRLKRINNPRVRSREARVAAALFFGASLLFHIGLNDTPLGLRFWSGKLGAGFDPSGYGRSPRDRIKDRWLSEVDASAQAIAASNFLAPHLFDRDTLYLLRYPNEPRAQLLERNIDQTDVALPDALFDFVQDTGVGFVGGVAYDVDAIRQLMQAPGWGLTAARDGLLRFERAPAPESVLPQSIELIESNDFAEARFGDAVELLHGSVEPMSEWRYRATFRWRAVRDFAADEHFVAVSALDGVPNARVAHLPSYALQPTSAWRAGQVREERFELVLPAEIAPGTYTWLVAWYDTRSPYAAQTDERSRIGAAVQIAELTVR